jgi:Xaa-Pro aminopeptidase
MQIIKPGVYEYEVEAQFDYILRLNGCPRDAFPIIVASGPNINILHYQENSRKMRVGELVMIDFGAEYSNYAADITRTLPVNGIYSNEQRAIYNVVLAAHNEVLRLAAPGVSYYYLYTLSRAMIIDGLLGWGVITGNRDEIISSSRYRQYIPAGLGHCVGLDVHDPFPKEPNGDKILKENMVLAIEPHVYLYEGDQTVNSAFWNISVRIEDDIVITRDGNRVLSEKLPREPSELEHWMNWAD